MDVTQAIDRIARNEAIANAAGKGFDAVVGHVRDGAKAEAFAVGVITGAVIAIACVIVGRFINHQPNGHNVHAAAGE
ncbi:MAG: hypothetical protein H0U74_01360 [Bradymonadaceae bacterium]|nr:hypothetical protein [Lujinxingiaceae bacterium]